VNSCSAGATAREGEPPRLSKAASEAEQDSDIDVVVDTGGESRQASPPGKGSPSEAASAG